MSGNYVLSKKNGQNKVKVVPIANNDIEVNEGGCLSTIDQVWLGLCCLISDFETQWVEPLTFVNCSYIHASWADSLLCCTVIC